MQQVGRYSSFSMFQHTKFRFINLICIGEHISDSLDFRCTMNCCRYHHRRHRCLLQVDCSCMWLCRCAIHCMFANLSNCLSTQWCMLHRYLFSPVVVVVRVVVMPFIQNALMVPCVKLNSSGSAWFMFVLKFCVFVYVYVNAVGIASSSFRRCSNSSIDLDIADHQHHASPLFARAKVEWKYVPYIYASREKKIDKKIKTTAQNRTE